MILRSRSINSFDFASKMRNVVIFATFFASRNVIDFYKKFEKSVELEQ